MEKIIQEITAFLSQNDRHALTVEQDNKRLAKPSKTLKNCFFLKDILEHFSSIEAFLNTLPEKGFDRPNLSLRKVYDNAQRPSYILEKKLTLNTQKTMNQTPEQPINTAQPIQLSAMGYASVPQDDWISSKIKESRYDELANLYKRSERELDDAKSKIRTLQEENNHLKMKIETAKERYELQLERELLNKKSFFETPSGEKISEVIAMAAPHLINNFSATPALNAPSVSPLKTHFINMIYNDQITDDMINDFLNQFNPNTTTDEQQ